jgi:uncharacterized membrane protein YfcA
MTDWAGWALLALVGALSSALNVVAGGGSFLTLPLLIFLGLPPTAANATNRVGVLLQSAGGAWGFHRHRLLDWSSLRWAALPASGGAVLGTWLALEVGDAAFRRILALLMVLVTLWTLYERGSSAARPGTAGPPPLLRTGLFVLVGVYGGFVQAGVGFFFMAVTTWLGIDLVRGNAIKLLSVLALTAVSLAIFAAEGRVDWPSGLALGLGGILGSLAGVHLTVRRGEAWIRRVVTAAVLAFAIKLWLG